MAPTLDDIGRALRAAREEAGMTQRELADASTVSIGTIKNLERGAATGLSYAVLVLLSAALGVDPDRLLRPSRVDARGPVTSYLASPYAEIDQPTDEEREWLMGLPYIEYLGGTVSDESIHLLLLARRKAVPG